MVYVLVQILFENSEKAIEKLGWLPGNVIHFKEEYNISIPHFGWNEIAINNNNWLFDEKNSSFTLHIAIMQF